MIRHAVILAAGVGSRLGTLTNALPKPLIEVGGKCPMQIHLENCARAGVVDVFINTHHLPEKVREFVGDGSRFGLSVQYSYEPQLLGTAGALQAFRSALSGAPFFVLYGDNLIHCDLQSIAQRHLERTPLATIALHHRDDVSTSGMVVCDENDLIIRFVEKPQPCEQVSNLVNAGIYALDSRVFQFLPEGVSDFGKDVFPELLARGEELRGFVLESEVLPIDTPELLAIARRIP
jgi:NDP-sugar pyrophosphorylase family protein